jgi:hypothetical protein
MLRFQLKLFFLIASFSLLAQKEIPKFGDVTTEELKMVQSPIDSTAGALVLFDYGVVTFDYSFNIVLERHIRIKIFNSSEFDRADVKIPYAVGDRVQGLKIASYNLESGKVVETDVKRKETFDEKVNDDVRQMRFSIPNVREGSVIEYTYSVNYGSWQSLPTWYFQKDIPSLQSEYIVKLPEYFEYRQSFSGFVPLEINSKKYENGRYQNANFRVDVQRFVAINIPAFVEEPYISNKDNYISKIDFELSWIRIPGQTHQMRMANSFYHLSYEWADGDYYGKSLESNGYLKEDLDVITAGLTDNLDKVKAIYAFVRDSFEVDYDVEAENLRRIAKLRAGYATDLNRVFVSYCREAGFDANLVRLSTRSNGFLNRTFPAMNAFDKTISLVRLDDQEYLLDPAVEKLPFDMLPSEYLNGPGLIISKENPGWVDLKARKGQSKMVMGIIELEEDGSILGEINIARSGYSAYSFRSNNRASLDEYLEEFKEANSTWEIEEHNLEGLDELEGDLVESISLRTEDNVEDLGNILYMDALPYGAISENPFKTEVRQYPVTFGMPVNEMLTYRKTIPEGYQIDEVPEKVAIGLPGNTASFMFQASVLGNVISVSSILKINKDEFSSEEYPLLRELYAQVAAKQSEKIILKKT